MYPRRLEYASSVFIISAKDQVIPCLCNQPQIPRAGNTQYSVPTGVKAKIVLKASSLVDNDEVLDLQGKELFLGQPKQLLPLLIPEDKQKNYFYSILKLKKSQQSNSFWYTYQLQIEYTVATVTISRNNRRVLFKVLNFVALSRSPQESVDNQQSEIQFKRYELIVTECSSIKGVDE